MYPLSRTVMRTVSLPSLMMTMFLGTLVSMTGIVTSFSIVSLRVVISQNTPLMTRKNRKTRNFLFTNLNKKFLTA